MSRKPVSIYEKAGAAGERVAHQRHEALQKGVWVIMAVEKGEDPMAPAGYVRIKAQRWYEYGREEKYFWLPTEEVLHQEQAHMDLAHAIEIPL